MARRPVDIRFDPTELLHRRLELADLDKDGRIKPQKLRLQISVNRNRWDDGGVKTPDASSKFNGYASVAVEAVRRLRHDQVTLVVLDEPSNDNEAHALVAMSTHCHCGEEVDEAIGVMRAQLAAQMSVTLKPTKFIAPADAVAPAPTPAVPAPVAMANEGYEVEAQPSGA